MGNDEYIQVIVKRINMLLTQNNMTVHRLHTLSEVSNDSLEKIVKGRTKNPKLSTIHKITLAFNMTVLEFLNYAEMGKVDFRTLRKLDEKEIDVEKKPLNP